MFGIFDFSNSGGFDIFDAALLGAIVDDEEQERRRRQRRDEMEDVLGDGGFSGLDIDESDITDYLYDYDGEEIGFVYIDERGHAQRHLYEDE